MKKKTITLLLACFCLNNLSRAQKIDTSTLILNSKMRLIEYIGYMGDREYYQAFINYQPDFQFLSARGFDSTFIFFTLKIKPTISGTVKQKENFDIIEEYFKNVNFNFNFVYNVLTQKIYQLDVRKIDEFSHFMYDVKFRYFDQFGLKLTKGFFLLNFSVEGVSFHQLFDCYTLRAKKNCFCNGTSPYIFDGSSLK